MTSNMISAVAIKVGEALFDKPHYPHIHPTQIIASACSSILPLGSVKEVFSALEPEKLSVILKKGKT